MARAPIVRGMGFSSSGGVVESPVFVFSVLREESWVVVSEEEFSASTERRRLDNVELHAPVFREGRLWTGPRDCQCDTCQLAASADESTAAGRALLFMRSQSF